MASRLAGALRRALDRFRVRISRAEALPQLALMGVITGFVAGAVIVAFRQLIEQTQALLLPGGLPDNFEPLAWAERLWLPILGGLAVGLLLKWSPSERRAVGVVHVMERLGYHQGRLPLGNAVVQFFGAAMSIIAGHSVGREGPSVHLGAASGSLAGQVLDLPNNSLRVLAGCGVAAAIAASFNTPLAGVIFAMEVVMMEYTVAGFAPVILAAVIATALSRLVYGSAPAFEVPALALGSLYELPYILAMGVLLGLLAAAFNTLLRVFTGVGGRMPLLARTTLAGLFVGVCALARPEIMGIGYDTVNRVLLGELGFGVLAGVAVFKLVATTVGLGLGLPGGLIGPTFVLGAAAGGALGIVGLSLAPTDASAPGFYALLGMGAVMAGSLQAPLAALAAMIELTHNANIIMPGMLAVVASVVTARLVLRQRSVFLMLMRLRGLDYRHDAVAQSLRRIGVGAAMEPGVVELPPHCTAEEAAAALARKPHWVLVRTKTQAVLLPAAELARQREEAPEARSFDLIEMPGERLQARSIDLHATLQQALETLEGSAVEALYVSRPRGGGEEQVYGVVTRADIERAYR